jgi:hypothetical protein
VKEVRDRETMEMEENRRTNDKGPIKLRLKLRLHPHEPEAL